MARRGRYQHCVDTTGRTACHQLHKTEKMRGKAAVSFGRHRLRSIITPYNNLLVVGQKDTFSYIYYHISNKGRYDILLLLLTSITT